MFRGGDDGCNTGATWRLLYECCCCHLLVDGRNGGVVGWQVYWLGDGGDGLGYGQGGAGLLEGKMDGGGVRGGAYGGVAQHHSETRRGKTHNLKVADAIVTCKIYIVTLSCRNFCTSGFMVT